MHDGWTERVFFEVDSGAGRDGGVTVKTRCAKCGKKASYLWSPDPDVRPVGGCKTHKDDVSWFLFAIYHMGLRAWKDHTRGWWMNKKKSPATGEEKGNA